MKIDSKKLNELKKQANETKPALNIGKSGVSSGTIETIDKYLTKYNLMKIKSLIAEDKEAVKKNSKEIAKQTQSEIVECKGFTFVLYRKN